MPGEEINQLTRRISEFSVKLDENCKMTSDTRDKVSRLENKLDQHETEHKEITRHMQETRQTLYFGTDRHPGLVEQALACKMARDAAKEADDKDEAHGHQFVMSWQGWLMLLTTLVLAVATVVSVIRMHSTMYKTSVFDRSIKSAASTTEHIKSRLFDLRSHRCNGHPGCKHCKEQRRG